MGDTEQGIQQGRPHYFPTVTMILEDGLRDNERKKPLIVVHLPALQAWQQLTGMTDVQPQSHPTHSPGTTLGAGLSLTPDIDGE